MAKETKRIDGSSIKGLGILDMNCTERKMVYGDDIHFSLVEDSSQELIGCQIQMIDTELQSDISFGQIIYGMGNNSGKSEGAKYKNVIFTNTLRSCFS